MDSDDAVELGVSEETVWLSLLSAFVHALMELAFLILEASSARTSFMHYSIVCFNGRFGWVPFVNLFSSSAPLS